jgi:hypothetical protein
MCNGNYKDVQDKTEKEHTMSLKDQADLVRRLGDMRRQHKRDQRRMEDVLSGVSICVPRRVLEMFSIAYVCVIIQRDIRENGAMVSDSHLYDEAYLLHGEHPHPSSQNHPNVLHGEHLSLSLI